MSRPASARQHGEAALVAARSTMEEEFREFVAARSGALLRTAYLLAGDWATAEDLLQTALTKTYLAWKRLGEIEAVEPYARRVLVNTATSWWRRRWHGERPTEVLPERPAPDRLAEHLERDALWQHVKTLPARQRAVLVLRFYEDLSEAQTAATLGISVGTVKSQTSRALASLRQRLSAEATPSTAHRTGVPRQRGAAATRNGREPTVSRADGRGTVPPGRPGRLGAAPAAFPNDMPAISDETAGEEPAADPVATTPVPVASNAPSVVTQRLPSPLPGPLAARLEGHR